MAYIEINHNELAKVASQIDKYIATIRTGMRQIDTEVDNLGASWEGIDYLHFRKEAVAMSEKDSVTGKMITSLKNYSLSLKEVSSQYRAAQAKAINKANLMCR